MINSNLREPNLPLIHLRGSVGESLREFGKPLGLKPSTVSRLETGGRVVGRVTALKLMDAYGRQMPSCGVTLEALMRGHF